MTQIAAGTTSPERVTVPVFAGAYLCLGDTPRTHRVELDPRDGSPIRVLCSKVKLASLMLDDATQVTDERPTCQVCARKYDRE
jgi:hypothetical protein